MRTDHGQAAKQLLDELSEPPEHERAQRITQACTGDVALRREVERLLALERESSGYFTELGEALNGGDAMPAQIGVYRIEREIGHGDMGTVFLGQIAEARSLLGASLARQGRFDVAEPLLLQAHASLEQSRGVQDPRTQDAFTRLVALRAQRSAER